MFNYSQKYFLIIFSFCVLPVCAMKRKELHIISDKQIEANDKLIQAVKNGIDNDFSQEKDWGAIRTILEQGADPNCILDSFGTTVLRLGVSHEKQDFVDYLLQRGDVNINDTDNSGWSPLFFILERLNSADEDEEDTEEIEPALQIAKNLLLHKADINGKKVWKETPLSFAARCGYNNLVKTLIECKADINEFDKLGYNPLKWAIKKGHIDVIIELCKAGALFYNLNNGCYNAFHLAIGLPKEHIKALIAHSRFGNWEIYDPKRDPQIKKIIKTVFCIFNRIGFPKEIQFNILSKLPPSYFRDANRGLCKKLDEKGYKHPSVLAQVNNNIGWISAILRDTNNKTRQSVIDYLYDNEDCDDEYKQDVESLLNGIELRKNYIDFDNGFPSILKSDPKNLICEMYINCAQLLDK